MYFLLTFMSDQETNKMQVKQAFPFKTREQAKGFAESMYQNDIIPGVYEYHVAKITDYYGYLVKPHEEHHEEGE